MQYSQMQFFVWKLLYFDTNSTEVCSQESYLQFIIIGPENSLAPKRRQAIIWTKDGNLQFTDEYMRRSCRYHICVTIGNEFVTLVPSH